MSKCDVMCQAAETAKVAGRMLFLKKKKNGAQIQSVRQGRSHKIMRQQPGNVQTDYIRQGMRIKNPKSRNQITYNHIKKYTGYEAW